MADDSRLKISTGVVEGLQCVDNKEWIHVIDVVMGLIVLTGGIASLPCD
jgi:hypothetical protein